MKTVAKEGRTVVRCQYCGKNLWPLRGLFDEDFCSRDHRQRYHERVRKALEHLPKGQATPRPNGIAGFQFEKPRVQQPEFTRRPAGEPCENPATAAVPDFAHATASPSLATSSFSFASLAPTEGIRRPSADTHAQAISANIMSIDSLRDRFEQTHGALAVALMEAPAPIAPRPGNMALQTSRRWSLSPEAFDELNHVYLHEPDPLLEANMPFGGGLIGQLTPVASIARAKHTAMAGPSGAGRVEFFPMQRHSATALAEGMEADALPQAAFEDGDNIWLEDFVSWRIPVSLAPNRSSMAMLPATDRAAALAQFRNASPASASSAAPLAWEFGTRAVERRPFQAARPGMASAMVIEFPAAREGAAAPFSNETAIFDAATFDLWLPQIAVDAGEMEMLTEEMAEVAPVHSDAFGPATKIGETLLPRGSSWFPIDTGSMLPTCSPEMGGALAEPQLGADLVAKPAPSQLRNGARSLNAGVPISMPNRAVRLKEGPEFFAAEPVVADSVALPVGANPYALAGPLAMPQIPAGTADILLQTPANAPALLPIDGFTHQVVLGDAANAIETACIEVPAIEAPIAGFATGEVKKIDLWARETGDRLPHYFGWMQPQWALQVPELRHEELPLALKVDVPEPRTVTVFETATSDQQTKVRSIGEARSKRFAVPSYIKGMAAGVMLASFLWFGSSSIKSDGMTLRPGDLLRLTIQRRAVYEKEDNFHAGLASWDGKNARSWAYDREGFIRPGRLVIYRPSRDMKDYKLVFLTQIEHKGVNYVFRAVDEQNYYGMKLAVTEPGPRPLVALSRYTVIDGKRESRGETPLQVMMHNNRPYRVEVDVKGNQFLTSIEGQVVDSWSDDRLKSGGVGFFTESSEKARLYWMKVTKNSDFLGKLCSMLVPKES